MEKQTKKLNNIKTEEKVKLNQCCSLQFNAESFWLYQSYSHFSDLYIENISSSLSKIYLRFSRVSPIRFAAVFILKRKIEFPEVYWITVEEVWCHTILAYLFLQGPLKKSKNHRYYWVILKIKLSNMLKLYVNES